MSSARPLLVRRTKTVLVLVGVFFLAMVGGGLQSAGSTPADRQPDAIRYRFNIDGQSVGDALTAFALQTGLQVARFSDSDDASTEPVIGHYTAAQALEMMLADSGLEYRFVNDHTIAVVKTAAPESQPVTADASARSQLSHDHTAGGITSMKQSKQSSSRLSTLFGAIAAAFAGSATQAQEAAGSGLQATALEEVVVTAERREANVQDIPIAVTALTGDALHDKAVARLEDLQFAAPAVSITTAGLTQSVNIRGVGLASGSPAVANGVASYVDGLFQPPVVTTNSFFDIADVQVLRGPQGTFVGSNSTGGAIFINSRQPDFTGVNGYAEADLGNYSKRSAQGAVNVPLGEVFAMRGAFNYVERDSYYDDHGPFNNSAGGLDELSGRVSLLVKPNESFQALARIALSNKDTGGYAYRPIPGTTYAAGRVGGIYDLSYDTATQNEENADVYSLELRYLTDGGVTFRALSGYQDKDINNFYDLDGTTLAQRTRDQYVRERVWTEEINVISPTDGAINWIVGAYYQRNKIDVDIFDRVGAGLPTHIDIPTDKTTTGYFGQLGYHLTDSLEVQLGLRYSEFESETPNGGGVYILYGSPANPNGIRVVNLSGKHEDGEPTGKLSLNWKVNDDTLLYAFVARGYKAGGFNSAVSQFDPETVMDYELGWKSTLLDGHVRTSMNAFYYDYQDFQTQIIDLSTGRNDVTNVANATVQGLEIEAQAQLGYFRIDVGAAYVDSELSRITLVNTRQLPGANLGPQCAAGQTTGCFNYTPFLQTNSGGVNLFSPELTYNVGVQYELAVGEASLTPRLNYGYVDEQYTNLLYNPRTDLLAARGLLSALVTYERKDWAVQLYGTNLADKEYVTGQGDNNEFYGAPREYGARLTLRF